MLDAGCPPPRLASGDAGAGSMLAIKSSKFWVLLTAENADAEDIQLEIESWELKLSGILKNWDFWGLFSEGMWVFRLETRVRGSSCND